MNPEDLTLDDFEKELPPSIAIEALIEALLDEEHIFPARYLYRLSDLPPEDLRAIGEIWPRVALERRRGLLDDLQALAERDLLLSFEGIGRLALEDADPVVRFGGVQALTASECTAPDLVEIYLALVENDPDANVQAVAAEALSAFVYAGEVDKLPSALLTLLEERLLAVMQKETHPEVRRRTLEALGFSSRPEVPGLILEAIQNPAEDWQASALFAMGRSADEAWEPHVLPMLSSASPVLRAEAARAAGELELKKARRLLIDLTEDRDPEVRSAALWSLSQIGGRGVREVLRANLEAAVDDEEIRFLEDALDNLTFTEGGDVFNLLDISAEELADLMAADDEDDWLTP